MAPPAKQATTGEPEWIKMTEDFKVKDQAQNPDVPESSASADQNVDQSKLNDYKKQLNENDGKNNINLNKTPLKDKP